MAGHQKDNFFVLTALHGGPRGGRWGQKTAFLTLRKATLGNRGHKTARRAAQRPPTGKPKVSRVTSGYGGDMIPLSQVHIPGQLPFLSAHWGPQSLQQTPVIVRVRQVVVVVGEFGEEVGETVGLVVSCLDSSSPLLVRLAARTQLADVLHSTFTWFVTGTMCPSKLT